MLLLADRIVPLLVVMEQFSWLAMLRLDTLSAPTAESASAVTVKVHGMYTLRTERLCEVPPKAWRHRQ